MLGRQVGAAHGGSCSDSDRCSGPSGPPNPHSRGHDRNPRNSTAGHGAESEPSSESRGDQELVRRCILDRELQGRASIRPEEPAPGLVALDSGRCPCTVTSSRVHVHTCLPAASGRAP